MDQLATWCKKIGAKLLDETIDPDEVLKGTLETKALSERPAKMPITVDWPEEIYKTPEAIWSIVIDGQERMLSELSIELVDPALNGPLRFAIASDAERVELTLELFEDDDGPNCRFGIRGDQLVHVRRGGSETESIADFFYDDPPVIWFADGSSLEGNQYVELKGNRPPYDPAKIQAWDWSGVDLRKESQGIGRDATSIQARVIRELKKSDYVTIVDDDGKGEAADVVGIRLVGDRTAPSRIDLEFYHCKYSQEGTPGHRIKDLYEVCGQAQKSISWMISPEKRSDIFTHLLRRDALRQEAGASTRFEVGDEEVLLMIREMSRQVPVTLKVFIVQPGVSKATVTRDQLQLMSVTETYLLETYQLPFAVIASA